MPLLDFSVNIESGDTGEEELDLSQIPFTDQPKIYVELVYPLDVPLPLRAEKEGGWTLKDFVDLLRKGYRRAYKNAKKYKPWGHELGQQWLEGYEEVAPGVFEIYVGS